MKTNSLEAWYKKGQYLYNSRKLKESIEYFDKVIEFIPTLLVNY